jgi:hypothetical protein
LLDEACAEADLKVFARKKKWSSKLVVFAEVSFGAEHPRIEGHRRLGEEASCRKKKDMNTNDLGCLTTGARDLLADLRV